MCSVHILKIFVEKNDFAGSTTSELEDTLLSAKRVTIAHCEGSDVVKELNVNNK
ncbi:hypothetical protein DPMN_159366 [Dreissena polymorpha]|uniref:Uncharacterized protein n=1 Tax=Dreissena polymorpha TaxID=45954 RepID=A0A9D4IP48_DREPO|nr:hypothetical protein DPMN_159366 [Dreissena polymorpha]